MNNNVLIIPTIIEFHLTKNVFGVKSLSKENREPSTNNSMDYLVTIINCKG